MHGKTIAYQLELSGKILEMNTKDVSHDESLVTPPKGGSCLNQVLGHMTRTRNLALSTMGHRAPFPMEDFDPYDDRTGVPFSPENALPFESCAVASRRCRSRWSTPSTGCHPKSWPLAHRANMTGDPNETVGSNLATFRLS